MEIERFASNEHSLLSTYTNQEQSIITQGTRKTGPGTQAENFRLYTITRLTVSEMTLQQQ